MAGAMEHPPKLFGPECRIEGAETFMFEYPLPEGQLLDIAVRPAIAISPDGRSFLYQTPQGLYVRAMEELAARPIPGTDNSVEGRFSPRMASGWASGPSSAGRSLAGWS